MNKKVQLVLGSGGARGMAHIGVIRELENQGFEIEAVYGCSMGSVVGGLYAAKKLDDYSAWLQTLSKTDVVKLLDFTLSKRGFIKGTKLFQAITDKLGHAQIEDFDIPFTAVATDMTNMKEEHYSSGDLYEALRASISIPGFFTPAQRDGKLLVDGGLLNPLPINLAQKKEDNIVIAVNLNASSEGLSPVKPKGKSNSWIDRILDYGLSSKQTKVQDMNITDLLSKSYDFTQDRLSESLIALYKPDVLVNIPRVSCDTFEFYLAKEMISFGENQLKKALKSQLN